MKQLVIFPRGQVTPKDKERATKAGFVIVEADNPADVLVLIGTPATVHTDDLLMSALHAVSTGHEGQKFTDELLLRLKKREAQP